MIEHERRSTMKKASLFLSLFVLVSLACDMTVILSAPTNPAPLPTNTTIPSADVPSQVPASPTNIPATLAPAATAAALQPTPAGVEVTVDPLRIVLSPQVAAGVRGLQFPRAGGDEVAPWELTPGHVQLKLEGYVLQGKFHEPQIYVYPAQGYAEMFPAAFESMHRLNNILYDPAAPISNGQLPLVPFFNAGQVFASNIQIISFQNGRGVRFLTEYAQYAASANNEDLIYHFQGLTSDGAYYIIAILPISVSVLAANNDAAAILPAGGIPYPDIADPNADWQGYYAAVTNLLNTTSPEAFTPSLSQLDALIQSMRINQ
jgi:hypothetical protein